MTTFREAITPEPLGEGRYRVRYDGDWWLHRGPNGGHVAAGIVRAMEAEIAAPARQLRSLTVHYPAAPREGDAEVHVRIERSGRSMTSVSARLAAGDRVLSLALGACAAAYDSDIDFDDATMPDVEVPAEMPAPLEGPTPFHRKWRLAPAIGEHGRAATGAWMAPAEPEPVDAALLVALADTWVPAPFTVVDQFAAPTIDLSVHVRATLPRPAEPVLGEFRSSLARDGYFEEDGRLWAPDGTLLAQSRQLALTL